MEQPDRRRPQSFPYERLVNGAVALILVAVLSYAGASLVKFNETLGSLATKSELGVLDRDVTALKVGQAFEQRAVDNRLSTLERQVENLRYRAPGAYPSPN